MNDLLNYGLLVFTSFFTLINPVSIMPVFLGLTTEIDEKKRVEIARRAVIAAFLIIVAFAFSGQFLFKFFHISVDSLRIVGGVIFFVIGFDMLNARLSPIKGNPEEINTAARDIAITPLAIPMLCGPGSITNAIVLMEDAHTLAYKAVFVIALAVMISITYVSLASASKIMRYLGQTGLNVMLRLMGLIVMVIAVEFFLSGIRPFLLDVLGR
jgi:multiple antibiotic resistance protein